MPHTDRCRPRLVISDSLKLLRETLCIAQSAIAESHVNWCKSHGNRLQRLINEIDRHRPLGADGKHGDLHTETCGCEPAGLHCTHWHDGEACCRCGAPRDPAVCPSCGASDCTRPGKCHEPPHTPEIAGPDGLGYGLCTVCRQVWPCATAREKSE